MQIKQVILVRKDLKIPKGKMAAQVAHGAVDCALFSKKNNTSLFNQWYMAGMKKVVLYVEDLEEMIKYKNIFDREGIINSMIKDAGRTCFKEPTITVLGVGPEKEEILDDFIKNLKLV